MLPIVKYPDIVKLLPDEDSTCVSYGARVDGPKEREAEGTGNGTIGNSRNSSRAIKER